MPILTNSGRVAIAESVKLRPIHFAWGTGDGAWTTTVPAEDPNATALMNELGRRAVSQSEFVIPDENGAIVLPTGNFSISPTPTRHLYLRTKFTFTDESSSVIRELAVFTGTQIQAGLPVGQQYFTPAQVTSAGRMVHLQNFSPIYRSPAVEESFEVVITF